jgi:hypothetical protein
MPVSLIINFKALLIRLFVWILQELLDQVAPQAPDGD